MNFLDSAILFAKKCLVGVAESILPGRYFIQELPYSSHYRGLHPDFRASVWHLNFRRDKVSRDGIRWLMIRLLMDQVKTLASGDYAEFGTYKGKTAKIIFEALPHESSLYCFDTFTGFSVQDIQSESAYSQISVNAGEFGNTSEDVVRRYILDGTVDSRLVLRVGYFPDTFKGLENRSWRFVHLDCDLAVPMRAGLECFWPGLLPGGAFLIHDFNGYFSDGLQKVVWDFCNRKGVVPVPMPDSGGSAVLMKPLPLQDQAI